MKPILAAVIIGLLFVGCSKNNPVESSADNAQTEAMFSETSMYNTLLLNNSGVLAVASDSGVCVHDSLRNLRMLDSLKAYLTLSDEQFASLQTIGTELFTRLSEIRELVHAGTITKDSSKALVVIARGEFVTSVKLILTTEQQTLFDTWLTLYWDKPKPGPGGHGGHGHHGHGGH